MSHFEYHSPAGNLERGEDPRHTFELQDDAGNVIAGAEIDYYSRPIPHYQVTDIWVDHAYKGRGIATQLMERIEEMLKTKKRPGFLVDAIMEGDTAKGFYARRGWIPVPGIGDRYVYNMPKGVGSQIFIGAELR